MDYEDLDGYLSKFWFAAKQSKLDSKTQKPKKTLSSMCSKGKGQ